MAVLIRRAVLVALTFAVMLGVLYGMLTTRPTGLVPDEDQGYMFAVMQLPAGASLERTNAVVDKLTKIINEQPGIGGVASISGFNLLTGLSTSYNATAFIRMKPWDERHAAAESAGAILRALTQRLNSEIKDANILVLNPPPIRGLGTTGGFEFILQSRGGGDLAEFSRVLQGFLGEARKRPELGFVFANFDDRVPQIEYEVDRDKVKTYGISLSDVFFALQTFLGGYYVNDFNLYGRTFRVQAQAEGYARAYPEDVRRYYVRSGSGDMVPLCTVLKPRPINGPEYFQRYNIYRSASINGAAAPGYSSGQAAQAMEELAKTLPAGYSYEWTGATFQEKKTGGQTGYIFALSLLFVFLVLAALYESWAMPVAILLVIPFGVFGAFSGLIAARIRQQRVRADRAHHADRAGGEERDPDRRVREARARARRIHRRRRACRRAAAPAADPDDLVRVHPRHRAAGDRDRRRRRRAPVARHHGGVRHVGGDHDRHLRDSGVFCRDPAHQRTQVAIRAG